MVLLRHVLLARDQDEARPLVLDELEEPSEDLIIDAGSKSWSVKRPDAFVVPASVIDK